MLVVVGIPLHQIPERVRGRPDRFRRPPVVLEGEVERADYGVDEAYDTPVIEERPERGRRKQPARTADAELEDSDPSRGIALEPTWTPDFLSPTTERPPLGRPTATTGR